MSVRIFKRLIPPAARRFSALNSRGFKVAVIGAAGSNGQATSLFLSMCPLVTKLAVHDYANAVGVAADLSHIDRPCRVEAYEGPESLPGALKGTDLVVIATGLLRIPNMTREQQFDGNAKIIKELSECMAVCCPKTFVVIISNPVNSLIPIVAKVFENCGNYDPKRLFGITSIDTMRARKFIGDLLKVDPKSVSVPVICGHSAATIVPVISQSKPPYNASHEEIVKLTETIIQAGTSVVKAKNSVKCASLSMGYTSANFIVSILKGLSGEKGIKEYTFVPSDICDTKYFASEVVLGKNGIEGFCELPKLNEYEESQMAKALPALKSEIKKGEDYVK